MKNNYLFIILTLLLSQVCLAQFSVSAVVTDEECPGTGALSLSVQNADPSAPVNYKVYLLPETNVPFWNSSNSELIALQDGDYLIIASQTINGNTVTAQTEATIGSNYVPLAFSISSVNAVCGNDGSMVINVASGNPVTYEILDGPATAGPQSSNVFNGLPAGTYEVRVTDACGNGFVSTQTFYVDQPTLAIEGPTFPNPELETCNKITISFNATSTDPAIPVVYPLTVQYTVNPPNGGAPIVYNQTVTQGTPASAQLTQIIQYYSEPYSVDIEVIDICGTTYELNNNFINRPMSADSALQVVLCGFNTLSINPVNHKAPFNINFTSAPAGFNASNYNGGYPGPFNGSSVTFGSTNNPMPLGSYAYTVTDACGRTATGQVIVEEPLQPEPAATASNHDCIDELGIAEISIANHPLQTASIITAPSSYSQPLPYNCTAMINAEGNLTVDGLPQGDYVFELTDICGNTYPNVPVLVPGYTLQEPEHSVRPDCTIGKGTIRINSNITSVIITDAPSGSGITTPYDVSFNIDNGIFAMDDLAAGSYTFNIDTTCESDFIDVVEMPVFEVTTNEVSSSADCNNFGVTIDYESNSDNNISFWLQLYNDDIDSWVHPQTGEPYTSGEIYGLNALELVNGSANNNFSFIGEMRVMKLQKAFTDGSEGRTQKLCMDEYYRFSFYNELEITGIYNLTCVGDVSDIQVNVQGVGPLRFEIISKNGDPSFYVDNGEDPVFLGLEYAIYQVRVTDPCGGYRVEQFNVAELPPLVSATQPEDLGFCDYDNTGQGTFDLSSQNEAIIGGLDPEIVTITYHASSTDASLDLNPLPTTYTSGTAEIFARVEWNVNPECYGLASFNLIVAPPTPLVMEDLWAFCEGNSVTVVADPGYLSYTWSTGETTQSIEVSEPGTYTVTVVGTTTCEISKTIEVVPATPPVIQRIETDDFNGDENTVTVITAPTEHPELYEFSIDGINFQDSNVFTNVPAGEYTVYVRDQFGCNAYDQKEIYLLNYPKFFTPNGDGIHDKWRIEYAILEPNMIVYIYDRYGKPIAEFGATSEGWDGTFQGLDLPATDYWFVVKRQDGRELRGHFAMMR